MEGVFLDFFCFKIFFYPTPYSWEFFSIPSPPICITFLFNWIWNQIPFNVFEFNSIQFESNSMIFGLNFNSIEKIIHALFSFKWSLISTKSILVFHHWSSLVVHTNVEPKLDVGKSWHWWKLHHFESHFVELFLKHHQGENWFQQLSYFIFVVEILFISKHSNW